MLKKNFWKKNFWMKNGKKHVFEANNRKKFDEKVPSWPREMVDSLKNKKNLVWNDSEKITVMKKDCPK